MMAALALGCAACAGDSGDGKGSGNGNATGGDPPAPPTMVAAMVTEPRVVVVTWQDNSPNEQGFAIHRQAGSGDFKEVGRTGANVTEYRDTTVSSGREYIYRVAVLDGAGKPSFVEEDVFVDVP
jgi:hypothetical protein